MTIKRLLMLVEMASQAVVGGSSGSSTRTGSGAKGKQAASALSPSGRPMIDIETLCDCLKDLA